MSMYEFDPDDAKRFGREQGIQYRIRGDELQMVRCPYCRNKTDDKNTFAINLRTGQFNCKRSTCGAKGNMITLSRDFHFSLGREVDEYFNSQRRYKNLRDYPVPESKPESVAYMESRGISKAVTETYNITTRKDDDKVLVFPFFDEKNQMQFIKYRKTDFVKGRDRNKEWCEENCKPILFGMNHCDPAAGPLVMTEGQIDSLSCTEAGIMNAVSVPTGAKGFTWVPYCWDWLGTFNELIIFGDHENDKITLLEEMRHRFHGTVKRVRPDGYQGCKDANELLQKFGPEAVRNAVDQAVVVEDPLSKDLSEVARKDVMKMEHFSTGFGKLDKLIGGFFLGSLVLLTGERGHGKSTLASQFGIFAIKQGYATFFYSGEMPDFQFRDWFDRQVAGNRYINKTESNLGFTAFSVNGMYEDRIAAWYRGKARIYEDGDIDDDAGKNALLETMETNIKQYGIQVLIIDNLMTAMEDDMSSDLYRQQTVFVGKLAKMAKTMNVVIILVVHPRKANARDFGNDDVMGSSNITNLAHVVLRYTEPKERSAQNEDRVLQTLKSRLVGRIDRDGIPLFYQESSKRISESQTFDWTLGWEPENQTEFNPVDNMDDIPW